MNIVELAQAIQETSPIELLRSGSISESQYQKLIGGGMWEPLIKQLSEAVSLALGVLVSVLYAKYHTDRRLKERQQGEDLRYSDAVLRVMEEEGLLPKTSQEPFSAQEEETIDD